MRLFFLFGQDRKDPLLHFDALCAKGPFDEGFEFAAALDI